MAKLIEQRYGKAQVRVLKILRDGPVHTIREIEVSALLAGDFETSYTAGDNTKVVPTDTIKNTVNVFAKQHLEGDLERFAAVLGQHFVKRYEQVAQATIEITERGWDRLESGGKPHPHAFQAASEARKFARAICPAGAEAVRARHGGGDERLRPARGRREDARLSRWPNEWNHRRWKIRSPGDRGGARLHARKKDPPENFSAARE